jgi:hypothetical protein
MNKDRHPTVANLVGFVSSVFGFVFLFFISVGQRKGEIFLAFARFMMLDIWGFTV